MTWLDPAVLLAALTLGIVLGFWLGARSRQMDYNEALRAGREECESHHERSKA